jgi:hypothetical protein
MRYEGHGLFFAVREDLIRYLVDEEIKAYDNGSAYHTSLGCNKKHTYNQAFHFILAIDLYAQRFCYPVVVLERTTTGRHDAELLFARAIVMLVVGMQLAHKFDACVYPVRLELEEV